MNINLQELYRDLRERQPLPLDALRPGKRIGVIYPDSIHLITIAAVGPGRIENYSHEPELIAVAKKAMGSPAIKWDPDGTVHLMKKLDVSDCVGSRDLDIWSADYYPDLKDFLEPKLGVLWNYAWAVWEPLQKWPVVRVTKAEKLAVWKQTPLEKLVDDNSPKGEASSNTWFYERPAR